LIVIRVPTQVTALVEAPVMVPVVPVVQVVDKEYVVNAHEIVTVSSVEMVVLIQPVFVTKRHFVVVTDKYSQNKNGR